MRTVQLTLDEELVVAVDKCRANLIMSDFLEENG
jgi:hypothetical protein